MIHKAEINGINKGGVASSQGTAVLSCGHAQPRLKSHGGFQKGNGMFT